MEPSAIEKKVADKSRGGVTLKRQIVPGKGPAASRHAGRAPGKGLQKAKRTVSGRGEPAILSHGRVRSPADRADDHRRRGSGGTGERRWTTISPERAGEILEEIDGKGRPTVTMAPANTWPRWMAAASRLTIDASIQSFCEQAAREAHGGQPRQSRAHSGHGSPDGRDSGHGEQAGLRSERSAARRRGGADRRLCAIAVLTDAYEPGSTFKMLTIGRGAGQRAVKSSRTRDFTAPVPSTWKAAACAAGASLTARRPWPRRCRIPAIPVFVETGPAAGNRADSMTYLEAFGIGSATGVDIPGEAGRHRHCPQKSGQARGSGRASASASRWRSRPCSCSTAACSVVNGGNLHEALRGAAKSLRRERRRSSNKVRPRCVSHTISEETSAAMRTAAGGRGGRRRRQERPHCGLSRRRQDRHGAGLCGRRGVQRHAHRLVHGLRAHGRIRRFAVLVIVDRGGRGRRLTVPPTAAPFAAGHSGTDAWLIWACAPTQSAETARRRSQVPDVDGHLRVGRSAEGRLQGSGAGLCAGRRGRTGDRASCRRPRSGYGARARW